MAGWASNAGAAIDRERGWSSDQPVPGVAADSPRSLCTASLRQPWRLRKVPQQVSSSYARILGTVGRAGGQTPALLLTLSVRRRPDSEGGTVNARLATAAHVRSDRACGDASFILTTVAMDSAARRGCSGRQHGRGVRRRRRDGRLAGGRELRQLDTQTLAFAAGGGALAFWAAPLLALTQRATSAPSGADYALLHDDLLVRCWWCAGAYLASLASDRRSPA